MGEIASTIVGGLIAALSGALAIVVTDWVNRRSQRTTLEREALVEWVSAYEVWVSLYSDYAGLVLQQPSFPDDDSKNMFLERMKEAAEAGRRLDVSKYRILIVERRDWVRTEVTRLTKASDLRSLTSSSDLKARALAFRLAADGLRSNLEIFLRRLVGAASNHVQV